MPSLVVSSGSFHSRLTRVVPTFKALKPKGVPGSLRKMIVTSVLKKKISVLKRKRIKSTLPHHYVTTWNYLVSKSNLQKPVNLSHNLNVTEVGRAVQCRHSFPFFLASLILASSNATHKGVRLSIVQLGLSYTTLIRRFFLVLPKRVHRTVYIIL